MANLRAWRLAMFFPCHCGLFMASEYIIWVILAWGAGLLPSIPHVPLLGSEVGGVPLMMNIKNTNMDYQNKKRNRDQLDAEQENIQSTNSVFPRFLSIESTVPDQPLWKLSPFVIEKVLVGLAGSPKSFKKLKRGSLLVEVEKATHAQNLLKLQHFFNIPSKCTPNYSLNSSKGIIRCPDLADVSDDDITSELSNQNVRAARRIRVFRDGVRRPTNTIVLTFGTSILPKSLKVGYLGVAVDLYIPNPLQCYCCYKFGHHENRGKLDQGEDLCRRCGNSNVNHKSEVCDLRSNA